MEFAVDIRGFGKDSAGRPVVDGLRVLGLDPVTERGTLRCRVGAQLQESALPDRIRVGEALERFAILGGRRSDWRALLRDWGLADPEDHAFATLSGGQRQRLFVALALVASPELVFLDEMTTGLDPVARRTTWELVERVRDAGTTVVLVTHVMEEAERLCDRVAVLRGGRLVALGTPAELAREHGGPTRVTFTAGTADVGFLAGLAGVERLSRHGPHVTLEGTGPVLVRCAAALAANGLEPSDLRGVVPTLEDALLALTAGEERP